MFTLAQRARGTPPSAVREILKVAEQPDVMSFAGGLPAPELFPVDAVAAAHGEVLRRDGQRALQYSTTEGYGPLREWIAHRHQLAGAPTEADAVLITSGSQQGIDLVSRVLLDPGAVVVTTNPTYLAALQVFHAAQARIIAVDSDGEGMRLDRLAAVLGAHDVRLVYVVPNFANPTGVTWSVERRAGLLALAEAFEVPVLEDDPYGEIRFHGEALPSLAALDDAGLVITLSTFSKMLAPGLRLGWLRAPPALRRHLVVAKQACDLHSATLAQRVVAELLQHFDLEAHLATVRAVYRERCQVMVDAVARDFPPGTVCPRPDGGMFLWARLPGGLDTARLLPEAVSRHRVAYVPGAPFFVDEPRHDTLRLNFSNRQPSDIVEGIGRLGALFGEAGHAQAAVA